MAGVTNLNILIRCDGSVEIGMGHVVRCLALADELKTTHECTVKFAVRTSSLGIDKIKRSYDVFESQEENISFDYKGWLTECIKKTHTDILILDVRDNLSRDSLRWIKKETGIKIVTIDDPEDKRLESDIALYPPVPQVRALDWTGYRGEMLSGWEYVILRKEFLLQYPKIHNAVPSILVSMGGTDPKNMTGFVVDCLHQIHRKFSVVFLTGSGFRFRDELLRKLSSVSFGYTVLTEPPNVAEVMSRADIAVISFGQTAYELAALHVPSIYICLTEDHYLSSTSFEENGLGVSEGIFSDITNTDIAETIDEFVRNNNDRIRTKNKEVLNISRTDAITKKIIELKHE